ncbi:MAG: 3-deoxy-D-manno-octulosonic acid kinase [Luteimonas sp.]
MARFDASESLTPFRDGSGRDPRGRDAGGGFGSILSDAAIARQVGQDWFDPAHWEDKAQPVGSGGRGGAWFIEGPFGHAVLRRYLRGGLVGRFNRDLHLWRGSDRVRSFAEFRLARELRREGLPVPEPIAACYLRQGPFYRAAILMQRLCGVRSLADLAAGADGEAPWKAAGELIARCHRGGLDHVDLNAHNILFDEEGRGWVIDLDRCRKRLPETAWRSRNLARLERSLLKLRGERPEHEVRADFARLRAAYDARWAKGY